MFSLRYFYLVFSSEMENRTLSQMWGRLYLPVFLFKVRTFSFRPEEADPWAVKACHEEKNFLLLRTLGTFVLIIYITKQQKL